MSLLGSIGGIVGGIGGFISGGPAGAIAGYKLGSSLGGGSAPTPSLPSGFGPFVPAQGGGLSMPFPVNGPGGVPLPGYNPAPSSGTGGTCPRGYHLNKHALAASKHHGALPARSTCVRNRHLNPMNPRALSRALRREKRARKIVRKLHVFAPIRHQRLLPGRRK